MAEPFRSTARQVHWDVAYRDRGITGVSWFQPTASTSLALFDRLAVPPSAAVVDIGGGASVLVDDLLARGFSNLTVVDVSAVALEAVGQRLGQSSPVTLVHTDLLSWKPEGRYDVWHDRAVFHFLVDERDRDAYLKVLRSCLRPGGIVILATFALDGPEYCSGLPVSRYSASELTKLLGPEVDAMEEMREEHLTPSGAMQPFTWLAARIRRTSSA